MKITKDPSHPVSPAHVLEGRVRFSLLGEGLLRMEYDPAGLFEDRPGVHSFTRPEPVAFEVVRETAEGCELHGGAVTAELRLRSSSGK